MIKQIIKKLIPRKLFFFINEKLNDKKLFNYEKKLKLPHLKLQLQKNDP